MCGSDRPAPKRACVAQTSSPTLWARPGAARCTGLLWPGPAAASRKCLLPAPNLPAAQPPAAVLALQPAWELTHSQKV